MVRCRRVVAWFAAVALTTVLPVTVTVATVSATTCPGGAVTWVAEPSGGGARALGPYVASSRCRDVALKVSSGDPVAVCMTRTAAGDPCTSWTEVPADGRWRTIGTEVPDGTRFWVALRAGTSPARGRIAY